MKRIVILFLILIVLSLYLFFKVLDYIQTPQFVNRMQEVGLGTPVQIPLSGTGSMFPTFPKGTSKDYIEQTKEIVANPLMYDYPSGLYLFNKRYYEYKINHRDIVSFINDTTRKITTENSGEPRGFVKRVIALPGDTIEIRDGNVNLNGEALKEPYIARARSTFGGTTVHECTTFTVPANNLFVMGDNRTGSLDSRHELGLVKLSDISHFIPYTKQLGVLDQSWHDASGDLEESARISLDKNDFLSRINARRKESGLKDLKINTKLEQSASKRGTNMLANSDFSFEATRSGYTMEKAMREVGYSNIVWGEAPFPGYYQSEELYDGLLEYANMEKFFLNKDYQDIGIGEVTGLMNGCPSHVIVIHLGGYVPPNYTKENIDSWRKGLAALRDTYAGWKGLQDDSSIFYAKYKAKIDRLVQIYDQRIAAMDGIVKRMESNQWLTAEQERYIKNEEQLYNEQTRLSNEINSSF